MEKTLPEEPAQMSEEAIAKMNKRALKKIEKTKRWEAKKAHQRQKQKEKGTKKPRSSLEHIIRFNHTEDGDVQKLSKQVKQQMFKELVLKGPKLIIDCDYEKLMTEKEIKSLCQQLAFCTNINKQVKVPVNLQLTGITGAVKTQLTKQNYQNWPVIVQESSYLEYHPKEDLVYLTADSENIIKELDPAKAYIIGGIVDRNRYKHLTLNKANSEGIQHAKLPIGEFIQLKSSTVLTVNHVFEILTEWYQSKDWKFALNKVIPERKQDNPDTEEKVVKVNLDQEVEPSVDVVSQSEEIDESESDSVQQH